MRSITFRAVSAVAAGTLMLAACGGSDPQPTPVPDEPDREVSDEPDPDPDPDPEPDPEPEPDPVDVDDTDVAAAASAANTLGFSVHQQLGQDDGWDGNVITSPLSIGIFTAMVTEGADGETRQQLLDAFGTDELNTAAFGQLQDLLADTDDVTINVANSLWASDRWPVNQDYIDRVETDFRAAIFNEDLGDRAAVDVMDSWVEEQTEQMIDEIAEAIGLPDEMMVLALINAFAFVGEWTEEFNEDQTRPEPFHLADGSTVDVDMMRDSSRHLPVVDGDGWTATRLGYGDTERFGMELFLPDENADFGEFSDRFTFDEWHDAHRDLTSDLADGQEPDRAGWGDVSVQLPTFTLDWDASLITPMEQLGISRVFDQQNAELTPISPENIWLNTVEHVTFVEVTEEGTRAAAVTGGGMTTESVGPMPVEFHVDRPFVFVLTDAASGTALMLGSVTEPQ